MHMNPPHLNALPSAEQAKLRQWQLSSGLMTVICGAGMLLISVAQVWLFELYSQVWHWLIDAAIAGLVMGLGLGIARHSRGCLTASLAVLVLFLVAQLLQWLSSQRVGSLFLLLVPTAVLVVNFWTHRMWSAALAYQRAHQADE